ncbi:MAG: recombination mediator RecR [Acidimicrobiales bacterium]
MSEEPTLALFEGPIQDLVDELGRLPSIGPKSAQRIAFYLLRIPEEDALRLAQAIVEVKERTVICSVCFNIGLNELCSICADQRRDPSILCVVEDPRDVIAVEKANSFRGRYHVLGGALSPIEGMGTEQLHIRELLERVERDHIAEVIVCTNPNLEGDATAMYLSRVLKPLGVRVTRIASGLPVGADLEYADEQTLGRALEGRRDVET